MTIGRRHGRRWSLGAATPMWQRGLVYGLLWGVTITAGEALSLPFGHLSGSEHAMAIGSLLPMWGISGIAIAWVAFRAEHDQLQTWMTALLMVLLAVALSAINSAFWWLCAELQMPLAAARALGDPLPSWTNFFYNLWMTLFHGALFTAGCMLAMRTERTRHLLGDSQIARGKSEALLADAQFDALRARIDPAFLLRAMAEVQRRYAQDAPGADSLLDQLVAFLRHAMPGVRGGSSTLGAELRLAQAYAQLCEQIDPLRCRWRFHLAETPPDIAFPPRLLLPLLDQLTPAHVGGGSGELRLATTQGELSLTIHHAGRAARLEEPLVYRIRVALRATFGDACSLWINRAGLPDAPALVLRLPLLGAAKAPVPSPAQTSFPQEVHYG
ncbi:sensor histidine kinase [Variovorax sp. RT4R15]|uniref:sensor histidine kinase n=1 Tax=Variovorax sp. RT4R15 TaxID=3443737 RepID=UPI003F48520B